MPDAKQLPAGRWYREETKRIRLLNADMLTALKCLRDEYAARCERDGEEPTNSAAYVAATDVIAKARA